MKSAIITGATGFIGRNLVRQLSLKGIKVYAIVRDRDKANDIIFNNVMVIECEMNDYENLGSLIGAENIDVFYHLAWDGVFGDKRADYKLQLNNIKCACEAIKTSSTIGIKKFVFLGTVSQYQKYCDAYKGLTQNNIYGIAKSTADSIIKNLAYSMNIQYVLGIMSNIYGPGQDSKSFIQYSINKILARKKLSLTNCHQVYDFMHINDAVEALYLIGKSEKISDEYYIGNDFQRPLKDFINELRECIDKNADIGFGDIPYNGIDVDYSKIDVELLYKEFDFKCKFDFKSGIKNTLGIN
ncbi:NAD-dependent epimerase/dehydratase family protein [Clostridium sp. YIM B02555]|uniref:NAD-dependent epimerase/dehydratase family protein n=1 Tax=Clostridium sp. YIM B02555 TaxID=2911968 RepID=UPI001EEEE5C1|nr:NAD-dependent epimerase/dehydratase family protein [Clostridium sp. YIM B02555]